MQVQTQTHDLSKYIEGEHISAQSEGLISIMTNLDPSSLSPYQETMIEGTALTIILLGIMALAIFVHSVMD